jgi:hypothetical protein
VVAKKRKRSKRKVPHVSTPRLKRALTDSRVTGMLREHIERELERRFVADLHRSGRPKRKRRK